MILTAAIAIVVRVRNDATVATGDSYRFGHGQISFSLLSLLWSCFALGAVIRGCQRVVHIMRNHNFRHGTVASGLVVRRGWHEIMVVTVHGFDLISMDCCRSTYSSSSSSM